MEIRKTEKMTKERILGIIAFDGWAEAAEQRKLRRKTSKTG